MKNIKFLQHHPYQRITNDETLSRIGWLAQDNLHTIIKGVIAEETCCMRGGDFANPAGWQFELEADGFWIQRKDAGGVYAIAQEDMRVITVDPAHASLVRYDLIQGRYSEVDENNVGVDIIDNITGAISQTTVYTDKTVKLEVSVVKGTAGAGVSPDLQGETSPSITGTPVIPTVDLSSKYILKLDIDKQGAVAIDCRGATPASTTIAEIISAINAAGFGAVASNNGGNRLVITSLSTGTDAYVELFQPTGAQKDNDALNILLGLTEDPLYRYIYRGQAAFFKLGEIRLQAGSANLVADDLRDVDRRGEWTKDNNTIKRIKDLYNMQENSANVLYGETVVGGLVTKDCVYWNTSNNRWEKAGSANMPWGVLTNAAENEVTLSGQKIGLTGLTAGPVYMDGSGNFTSIRTGIKVGFAKSSTILMIDIDMDIPKDYDIIISSQSEFTYYFGTQNLAGGAGFEGYTDGGLPYKKIGATGAYVYIPRNKTIFIKGNPSDGITANYVYHATNNPVRAYSLQTIIRPETGARICGTGKNDCILTSGTTYAGIQMDYTNSVYAGVTGSYSGDVFAVTDSSAYYTGAWVWHPAGAQGGNYHYKVLEVVDNTHVRVDRLITVFNAGIPLHLLRHGIEFSDFTYDGHDGVDGFPELLPIGRSVILAHAADCIFNIRVVNCINTGGRGGGVICWTSGGVASGQHTCSHIKIDEICHCVAGYGGGIVHLDFGDIDSIHHCRATTTLNGVGAGAYRCYWTHINKISFCTAAGYGGGISDFYRGTVDWIERCVASRGGGAYDVSDSRIGLIRQCSAIIGGGIHTATSCTIDIIRECYVDITNDNAYGGACAVLNRCIVGVIRECYVKTTLLAGSAYGGAGYQCVYTRFNHTQSCSATNPTTVANGQAGGFYQCSQCTYGSTNDLTQSSTLGGAGWTDCDECVWAGTIYNCRSGAPLYATRLCSDGAWVHVLDGLEDVADGGIFVW